jgi:hypothetical protein
VLGWKMLMMMVEVVEQALRAEVVVAAQEEEN